MTTGLKLPEAGGLSTITLSQVHATLAFVHVLGKVSFEVSLRQEQEREFSWRASPHRFARALGLRRVSRQGGKGRRVLHADRPLCGDVDRFHNGAKSYEAILFGFGVPVPSGKRESSSK